MRDEQYIVFDGPWRDDDRQFVQDTLSTMVRQNDIDHLSTRKVTLLAPVWKFEYTTLRTGSSVYLVSSLIFNVFAAAPSLPRLLGRVDTLLHDNFHRLH
jgi:hypothetical protein